jgi:citrate lyase subunit beta/citryl-CoA lyase
VNGIETMWCHDDIVHIVSEAGRSLDVLIVPKVREPRDVWYIDTLLTQVERSNGLQVGRIGLEILIEEASALARVDEIAACSDRLEALILGVADLSGSLGRLSPHIAASPRYPGDMWHYARARIVVAAKVNGLAAIDGPYADFRDASGYREQAEAAAELGADGKWAIHPDQIALANEVFAPSDEELENAGRVM